jgi:hypothetical protein
MGAYRADNVFQVEIFDSVKDLFDYLVFISDVIVAFVCGYWILKVIKRLKHLQWHNQKVIEKWVDLWSGIVSVLNDIYCYFMRAAHGRSFLLNIYC